LIEDRDWAELLHSFGMQTPVGIKYGGPGISRGEKTMPIYMFGKWRKAGAILLTKTARYIVPAAIAATGAVAGFFAGRRRKKGKE